MGNEMIGITPKGIEYVALYSVSPVFRFFADLDYYLYVKCRTIYKLHNLLFKQIHKILVRKHPDTIRRYVLA